MQRCHELLIHLNFENVPSSNKMWMYYLNLCLFIRQARICNKFLTLVSSLLNLIELFFLIQQPRPAEPHVLHSSDRCWAEHWGRHVKILKYVVSRDCYRITSSQKKESIKIWPPCSILHPLKDQADHLASEEPAGDHNQDLGCWDSDRTWRGQLQQVRQTDELRPHLGRACPQLALGDVPWIERKVTHNGNYHLAQRSGKLLRCQAETSRAHFCLALKGGLGVV